MTSTQWILDVDGQKFSVSPRRGGDAIDLTWLTGPNSNYGFTMVTSGVKPSNQQLASAVRDFLSNINPETGYLD